MDQVHNFYSLVCDAVDQYVVRMHHRLPRTGDPSRPVKKRMLGKPLGKSLDRRLQALRRRLFPLRDEADGRPDVVAR